MRKNELEFLLHTILKNQLKRIIDLNVRVTTITLSEANIEVNIAELGLEKGFLYDIKSTRGEYETSFTIE